MLDHFSQILARFSILSLCNNLICLATQYKFYFFHRPREALQGDLRLVDLDEALNEMDPDGDELTLMRAK